MKYRAELDGLRAIALVAVLLFHAGSGVVRGGYVGVDVFFVISGYLIASAVVSDLEAGQFSVLQFFSRRARRILPALYVVVLVSSVLAWAWSAPPDYREHFRSVVAVTTFTSNFFFWATGGYFDTESADAPLLHTWSLSVEEQFYLLFPLLALACAAKGRRFLAGITLAGSVASLVLAQWASVHATSANFYLLPTRAWEIGLGVLSALGMQGRTTARWVAELASAAGLAGIVGSALAMDSETPFPGFWALLPVGGAALVIRYASGATLVGRMLQSRPLVALGLMSYSGYLWHQPILALARQRALVEPTLASQLLLTCGALVLAYFSWKYVERPFRDRAVVGEPAARRAFLAGSLLLLALGMAGSTDLLAGHVGYPRWLGPGGMPQKFFGLQSNGVACSGRPPANACVLGDVTSHRALVLVGDSHARVLTEPAEPWARAHGMRLVDLTASSCPFLLGLEIYVKGQPLPNCGAGYQQQRLEVLRRMAPAIVVMHASYSSYIEPLGFDNTVGGFDARDPVFAGTEAHEDAARRLSEVAASLKRTISLVQSFGHRVILVGPVPTNGWDPVRRLYKLGSMGAGSTADEREGLMRIPRAAVEARFGNFNAIVADARKSQEGLAYVDSIGIFCGAAWCNSIAGETVLYSDEDHLSRAGAARLFEAVAAAVHSEK